jgi:hypothetical protein
MAELDGLISSVTEPGSENYRQNADFWVGFRLMLL